MRTYLPNLKKIIRFIKFFKGNEAGNVAAVSAILFPMVIVSSMTVFDIAQQSGANKYVRETAFKACNRVVGSSLTNYPSVSARNLTAKRVVDTAFGKNTTLENPVYTLETGKNTAQISITADRKSILGGSGIENLAGTKVSVEADCAGIPPFPRIDEIVYESNFALGTEGQDAYKRKYGTCWGIIDVERIGWNYADTLDGRVTNSCGLEVQDWNKCPNLLDKNAKDRNFTLPPGATNSIVTELDGHCNTGINKTFELHPGTYEFSMWYRGRNVRTTDTNQIGVYLQKSHPETLQPLTSLHEDDKVITMNDPIADAWKEYKYTIDVPEYGIYRVTILGEGASDSVGGLFTSFKLTYKELRKETAEL